MIAPALCLPPPLTLSAGIWDLLTALNKALFQMPAPARTAELQHPYPAFCHLYPLVGMRGRRGR